MIDRMRAREVQAILRKIMERGPDPYCGFEEALIEILTDEHLDAERIQRDENEACAKVCEEYLVGPCPADTEALYLPKAIRARMKEER